MFVVAAGRRELGKTTLVYSLAQSRQRRIIWDPRLFWKPTDGRIIYGGRQGFPLDEWPGSLELAWQQAPEVVIQPPREPEPADVWEWFCGELAEHLLAHPLDTWAVIVDEYGQVERAWPMRDWNFIVRSVARADVDIYVTAHKPIDVPPKQRSIVDVWCVFQTADAADRELLQRRGVPVDVVAQLPTLPPFTYYEWDESRGRGRMVTDSAAWNTNLTPASVSAERRSLFTLRKVHG